MDRVGPREIQQVLAVTDAMGIHRESVAVPLATRPQAIVRLKDGERIEIVAPANGFSEWLQTLPQALGKLDLSRVRRA